MSIALVPVRPAVIPAGAGAGKPCQTVLTDGEAFFCADDGCEFVGTTFYSVRAHRASHNGKSVGRPKGVANGEGKPRPVRRGRSISSMTVEQIEVYVEGLRTELSEVRMRAARAEDALATIQRALNSVRA